MTQVLANVEYKPTEIGTERLGQIMVRSGFFKDLREEAQAIVKILYGAELGFGPMASVMGVYIVDGRPSLSAQLIASAIQRSDRYTYRVREWTSMACRIEFFAARGQAGQGMESLGESEYTIAEATAANLVGKAVWKQYPKAMLWARAMSQGARAYTPEIFSGPIYTPEELGAVVSEDGRLVVDHDTGEVLQDTRPPYVPTREQDVPDVPKPKMVTTTGDRVYKRYADLFDEAVQLGLDPEMVEVPIAVEQLTRLATELKEQMADARAKRLEEVEAF